MARSKRVTITLPPELAAMIEEVRQKEGCTTTEFVQSAVRWKTIFAYGEMKATGVVLEGITAEEASELIHARRERDLKV